MKNEPSKNTSDELGFKVIFELLQYKTIIISCVILSLSAMTLLRIKELPKKRFETGVEIQIQPDFQTNLSSFDFDLSAIQQQIVEYFSLPNETVVSIEHRTKWIDLKIVSAKELTTSINLSLITDVFYQSLFNGIAREIQIDGGMTLASQENAYMDVQTSIYAKLSALEKNLGVDPYFTPQKFDDSNFRYQVILSKVGDLKGQNKLSSDELGALFKNLFEIQSLQKILKKYRWFLEISKKTFKERAILPRIYHQNAVVGITPFKSFIAEMAIYSLVTALIGYIIGKGLDYLHLVRRKILAGEQAQNHTIEQDT